jgi:putative inorganic carbon (HCO3(-)) transporter
MFSLILHISGQNYNGRCCGQLIMKTFFQPIIQTVAIVSLIYGILGGATGSGLLTPQYRLLTVILMALIVLGWLFIRWQDRWVGYHYPLTGALLCWTFAIAISSLANVNSLRRIAIGVWFALVYIGFSYVLHDILSNRKISRKVFVDILLLVGCVALFSGYQQLWNSRSVWLTNWTVVAGFPGFPRVQGTLGNPNILGALLLTLIPLILSRLMGIRSRVGKFILVFYGVLCLILLIITDSRSAWVGLAVGLGVLVVLTLQHYSLLSWKKLLLRWRATSTRFKLVAVIGSVVGMITVVAVVLRLVTSLGDSSRTLGLRTYIYDVALTMFHEKPFTGYGLFTFGRGLLRLSSVPPLTAHSHAHNLILNVAAEMGLPGITALALTFVLAVRAIHRSWKAANPQERLILAGCIASLVGLLADHVLDLPSVSAPIIFVVGLVLFMLVVTPLPSLATRSSMPKLHLALIFSVWLVTLVAGIWNSTQYSQYVSALFSSTAQNGNEQAAQKLERLSASDPAIPVYYFYQGYFLGALSVNGNPSVAQRAVEVYKQFMALEPYYAPGWANLATLYWQLQQRDEAIRAMEQAVNTASQDWLTWFNLARLYEAVGRLDDAKQAYLVALNLNNDAVFFKEWQQTTLRRSLAAQNRTYSAYGRIVRLMNAGHMSEALRLWEQNKSSLDVTISAILGEIILLNQGQLDSAQDQLAQANQAVADPANDIWVQLGEVYLARAHGDELTANRIRERINALLVAGKVNYNDTILAISAYANVQFWSLGYAHYLLPQTFDPYPDAIFMNLFDHSFDEF